MNGLYYLCFSINKIPDLTLTKYSVFDGSNVENIMEKHGLFLRQLHRLGYTSGVYFHLLYYYNPDKRIPKGNHLSIVFYATAQDKSKLDGIREFLTSSVLSTYYGFFCYEIAKEFDLEEEQHFDGSSTPVLKLVNISGKTKKYSLGKTKPQEIIEAKKKISNGENTHIVCEVAPDSDVIFSFNRRPIDDSGKIILEKRFSNAAFITKKDYYLPAQNRLDTDHAGEIMLYSIMEWEPCETGRLYNVLKLMEGYDRQAVLRIDIFPVEHTQAIRQRLPYAETRRRISDRVQGRDDNSADIMKSWDKYLNNLMKFPQFLANVVAFADSQDIAVMLADSVAAEAVESGTYLVETIESSDGFSIYESDARILHRNKEKGNYMSPFLSLYTLEEIRPMFSFPILYPGEAIERQKETDPVFSEEVSDDEETGEIHEVISLGVSSMGYDVKFPVKLFKKHAFIAGVPGAGKTNTMLYLVTTLWRDTRQHVPFLVLEPAKQEYRALAMIDGMEDLCVFSPGADTKFPLHINPFQFPVGLTLAEHIANLNTVFAGAFELIPPSPFLIDGCIEKVYIDKGWNINERNDGTKEFPTMQELYDSLKVAVEESGYEGETKSNIRSVMEVRIGSLLRREIGNVYNVYQSSMEPEEWLERPIIIELESLGEGPANFMSLLISTLIREVLKIKKTSDYSRSKTERYKREIEHIIFYEEAHNLIGSTTDDPVGGSVDPKISATKFLVKMLAEVRALGEGIVIADQLPTAMASEVLKNTGLKIGHRITAQDDRNLLGSTMSASADQLEEQGTFGTGQALVFYENLLRPFKMRISEWERGASQTKYDSPTNIQLYEHLKDNEIYKQLLLRSALIMQSKMKVEFDQLRNKAEMLKLKCDQNCSEIQELEDNLFILKRKYFRMDRNETSEIKKHIANTKREYEKKKREFSGSISQELKKTCWSYANQYYAYMTLSKNYSTHSNDMYMCTINNYISLFTILKSFPDIPELTEILMSETINVMTDIKRYVDYMFEGATAILQENTCYKNALFECGNYLVNCMNIETIHILKPAIRVANLEHDSESEIIKFTKKFTSTYFKFLNIAKKYAAIAEVLSNEISEKIRDSFELNSSEWGEYNARAVQYKNEKLKIYMTLAQFVVKVCKQISVISGMNRKWLLININEMLVSFRSIVDYRDRSAPTILSKWTNYSEIWKDSNDILVMEMSAKFTYLHQYRRDMMITLKSLNDADKISALSKIACQYNGWFKKYSKSGSESSSLKLILVNHYIKYLEAMIRLGTITHSILINTSSGNWRTCLKMMKNLMQEDKIDETKRESWKKLSIAMAAIFNAAIK